jgi:hypothetical protein
VDGSFPPIADIGLIVHLYADAATKRSDMSYQTDRRSRTRAITVYGIGLARGEMTP